MNSNTPYLDPCLPVGHQDKLQRQNLDFHVVGKGDWDSCRQLLEPLLSRSNDTQAYLNGVYQPVIDFSNSEFYGFSEFFYCTEDVLRMGGMYDSHKFSKAARVKVLEMTNSYDIYLFYVYKLFMDTLWSLP